MVEINGKVDHTEYWIGNNNIGGIDSNGNVYGQNFSNYAGSTETTNSGGGTIGKG